LTPDAMAAQSAQLDQLIVNSLAQDQAEYFTRAIIQRYDVGIDQQAIEQVHELLASGGS